jgi:putative ABC transport system permease protein
MNRFTPGFAYTTQVEIENQPTPDGSGHASQFRRISATYFAVMRIRLLKGRVFNAFDSLSTSNVALVSRSFADLYWPGVDPLGRRVKRGQAFMTVVGVVDDVSDVDLLQPPEPTLYAAWTQTANVAFPMGLVLRTNDEPEAAAPALRAAVAGIDRSWRSIESSRSTRFFPTRWRRSAFARRSCCAWQSSVCWSARSGRPV